MIGKYTEYGTLEFFRLEVDIDAFCHVSRGHGALDFIRAMIERR
jgi:hypothetical protein